MRLPKRIKGMATASHARAPKQEREIAKRVGGRVTRGSGCGNEKGDVRLAKVCRIEAKTTSRKSFSVTQDMLDKIEMAGIKSDEVPAFIVEFNDGNGKRLREVAIVPMWALYTLLDNAKSNEPVPQPTAPPHGHSATASTSAAIRQRQRPGASSGDA